MQLLPSKESKQEQKTPELSEKTGGTKSLPAASHCVEGRRTPGRQKGNASGQVRATVHLVQAYKLPARTGKLLKAKVHFSKSSEPCLFEPKTSLQAQALDIADSILQPDAKHYILLPVRNSSGSPIWLCRGETVG